jgi:hypothetical protein
VRTKSKALTSVRTFRSSIKTYALRLFETSGNTGPKTQRRSNVTAASLGKTLRTQTKICSCVKPSTVIPRLTKVIRSGIIFLFTEHTAYNSIQQDMHCVKPSTVIPRLTKIIRCGITFLFTEHTSYNSIQQDMLCVKPSTVIPRLTKIIRSGITFLFTEHTSYNSI